MAGKNYVFLFKLNDFELFVGGKRKGSYLPSDWRDYFGVPAEEHDIEYKVNLAEGYITTDKSLQLHFFPNSLQRKGSKEGKDDLGQKKYSGAARLSCPG